MEQDYIYCPECGSVEHRYLGDLGDLRHFRCVSCGIDHNITITNNDN